MARLFLGFKLFIFGCLTLFAEASPKMFFANDFYNVNMPINGSCGSEKVDGVPNDVDPSQDLYLANASHPCSGRSGAVDKADGNLLSRFGGVIDKSDPRLIRFIIETPMLKVYNIWCIDQSSSSCGSASMYNISISDEETALRCDLEFGIDSVDARFRRPKKVEWFKDGVVLEAKDLSVENFTGSGDTKQISILLDDLGMFILLFVLYYPSRLLAIELEIISSEISQFNFKLFLVITKRDKRVVTSGQGIVFVCSSCLPI